MPEPEEVVTGSSTSQVKSPKKAAAKDVTADGAKEAVAVAEPAPKPAAPIEKKVIQKVINLNKWNNPSIVL